MSPLEAMLADAQRCNADLKDIMRDSRSVTYTASGKVMPIRQRDQIDQRAGKLCDGCGKHIKPGDPRWHWHGDLACSETCCVDIQRFNRWAKTSVA